MLALANNHHLEKLSFSTLSLNHVRTFGLDHNIDNHLCTRGFRWGLFQLTVHKLHCLDASLTLISAESTLANRSPLCPCVCLTHFQQCINTEGPCGAQKEATPAACVSAPLRRQSVSQLTMPLCYRSSWPLFLLKVPEPPVYPPAKGPHAWGPPGLGSGANTGFRSDSLTISALLAFSPGHHSPSRGPRPLGERVWWSTVNIMCVTCVKWSRNYKFLLPLASLIKHTLNCIRCKELWVPHRKVFNIPVCVCMCIYIQCKQYIYSMSWCWET